MDRGHQHRLVGQRGAPRQCGACGGGGGVEGWLERAIHVEALVETEGE
jgi:hypothetical protein